MWTVTAPSARPCRKRAGQPLTGARPQRTGALGTDPARPSAPAEATAPHPAAPGAARTCSAVHAPHSGSRGGRAAGRAARRSAHLRTRPRPPAVTCGACAHRCGACILRPRARRPRKTPVPAPRQRLRSPLAASPRAAPSPTPHPARGTPAGSRLSPRLGPIAASPGAEGAPPKTGFCAQDLAHSLHCAQESGATS